MALYTVAGLPTQIDLPVPLHVVLIPTTQTLQRPGITRARPGYWVQHETGNPSAGANALFHQRYLANGAPDNAGNPQQLSYHFTCDDTAIYQMIPVDEVTWQAADGSGPGNMAGISCELCINQGIDKAKSRHNAEALAGGVMKALKMPTGNCRRHYDFNFADPNRHHCPDEMMSEGYWPTFVANVDKIVNPPISDQSTYPAAVGLPFGAGDYGFHDFNDSTAFVMTFTVECVKAAIPRSFASTKAPQSGEKIAVRSQVKCIAQIVTPDKRRWLIREDRARLLASSFTPSLTVKKR
jgi:N-acetylmuramoyl-L-alanine amidase